MSTPTVPKIEYAAFDAMCEVASSLKAAYMRRAVETDSQMEIDYWVLQRKFVVDAIRATDQTNRDEILRNAHFFATLLKSLNANPGPRSEQEAA
ncbi:hypothetical protein [Corynebacterium lizhenjunii]|uniref:hypothetical protein n=1 Tax=Corynebacterium lizhenjunii TaxID=2709394 RepID=UPI0013EA2574|nr:hypothetical protein [Corynebacterium lizhenjunii]